MNPTTKTTGFIYTLSDPETETVRYVGQTVEVDKRYSLHLWHSKNGRARTHKEKWINYLMNKGVKPIMEVVWEGNKAELSKKEMEFIKLFKSFGAKLTNSTMGGETTSGRKCSEETKEKFRKMFTGVCLRPPITQKEKDAASLRRKGRKQKQEHIDKMKATKKANPFIWRDHPNGKDHLARISKPIIAIKDNVETFYESTIAAEKGTGVNRKSMREVANGVYKQCKGYIFKFI